MGTKISAEARQQLVQAIGERYRGGSKDEKVRILDEFVAVTGFHRKHSIRILNTTEPSSPKRPPRLRLYDQAVREALVVLWEASDRICGKRLKPLVPLLIVALEKHGHLRLDEVIRTKLLMVPPLPTAHRSFEAAPQIPTAVTSLGPLPQTPLRSSLTPGTAPQLTPSK